ncbi:hypothetical protein [Paenibacillus sp. 1781tsa1]|uniref:hypothetical protein n=1 Tax=Paenibacillus sp. 1781tsa1 TaxID=2953810 RepID=UPI00209E4DB0|nr:hypothetical protein [Paenibacillus sp. 1781tsa1]MCP1185098.1 hypothetical protein [Paenibacillus sp. 1781tsa1]
MIIKNNQVEKFFEFLHSLELERKPSRMRTRLKNLLKNRILEIANETVEINKQHIVYDENNQPVQKGEEVLIKDKSAWLKDINEFYEEEFEIPQDINNREMLLSIKDSVLNHSPSTFKGDEADVYDMVCELVEQIEYE